MPAASRLPARDGDSPRRTRTAGWDQSLTNLVTVRGRALVTYARMLTGADDTAQDLVQDALVKVFTVRFGAQGRTVGGRRRPSSAWPEPTATDDVHGAGHTADPAGVSKGLLAPDRDSPRPAPAHSVEGSPPPSLRELEGYVRRAIATLYLDQWRRQSRWRRVRHLLVQPASAPSGVDRQAETDEVAAALGALTPRQRACVVLRYYEDLSTQQTADVLGVSAGTVKSTLHDAVGRLRGVLAPPRDPEPDRASRVPGTTAPEGDLR